MKKGTIAKTVLTILGVAIVGLIAFAIIGRNNKRTVCHIGNKEELRMIVNYYLFNGDEEDQEETDFAAFDGSNMRLGRFLRNLPNNIERFAVDNTVFYMKSENGTELLVGGWPGAVIVDIDEETLGIKNGDKLLVVLDRVRETYPAQAEMEYIDCIVKLQDASETELSERAKSEIESLRKMGWRI